MAKYRKKPVVIDAIKWDGTTAGAWELLDWIKEVAPDWVHRVHIEVEEDGRTPSGTLAIETLEDTDDSVHYTSTGDYVICGVQGELYACKPDIFEMTYDAVGCQNDTDGDGDCWHCSKGGNACLG